MAKPIRSIILLVLVSYFSFDDVNAQQFDALESHSEVPYEGCQSCHQKEYDDWQKSDHASSMAIASETSIRADFNDVSVFHYGQKAKFYRDSSRFMVDIFYGETNDKKNSTYEIKYSFGFQPLQQYLVETEPGRLQVLPFSWDARTSEQGGQRWYHNYRHEEISLADRLHWRQPLQNWNGMCADCHSDGLVRNYNPAKNTFDSQFENINVGCASCHGNMASHAHEQNTGTEPTKPKGHWQRNAGEKTASWQGRSRNKNLMDNCFACHSLRAPLTDGIRANKRFLDQFTPRLLDTATYHVDGQIKEEVYVYGSYLQSKMFSAGVGCMDCHDKHTQKIKIEGNGLCLQCHSDQTYDVKKHHQHLQASAGSQCVNCHMPNNRYMGVDDRRDHSFKIPRADLSIRFGTPNACVKCHADRTNEWAAKFLKDWHGEPKALSTTRENYYQIQTGSFIGLENHLAIIADESLPIITRATAIQLLNLSAQTLRGPDLNLYLQHSEDLLRLAAVSVSRLLPEPQRTDLVWPLLKDQLKAIRVAAVRTLIGTTLPAEQQVVFDKAYKELVLANENSSWRGEGRVNQAIMEIDQGLWEAAEISFRRAIDIDPYFEPTYINLAELYRRQNQMEEEVIVLNAALENFPDSAELQYAFGLHLIRQKQYSNATPYFLRAVNFAPTLEQYAYTYILSLDREGKTTEAMQQLLEILPRYANSTRLIGLRAYLSQKLRKR